MASQSEQEKNIDRRNLFGFTEGPSFKVLKRNPYGIYVKKEYRNGYIHQQS